MGVNTGASVAAAKPKVGGGLYYAAAGATLPVDASAALDAAFKPLGPISEDGVQPGRDTSVDKVKEWDGSTLAQLLTDESRSFVVKLYGVFDEDVQGFVNGPANVAVTPAVPGTSGKKITVLDKGGKPAQAVIVIDMLYGGKKMRKVIPLADSVITGEDPYVGGGLTGYEVTIEALKDESGTRVYEYYEDAVPAA